MVEHRLQMIYELKSLKLFDKRRDCLKELHNGLFDFVRSFSLTHIGQREVVVAAGIASHGLRNPFGDSVN